MNGDDEVTLDPAREPWLRDYRPTWTVPVLSAMSIVDRLAGAVVRQGSVSGSGPKKIVELRDVVMRDQVVMSGPIRTRTVLGEPSGEAVEVAFQVWRDASDPALSGFEIAATGTVISAVDWPFPPTPIEMADGLEVPEPYASGHLFQGPAFRYLKRLWRTTDGSSALLDATWGTVRRGTLHQGMLDAVTHAIPHDELFRWSDQISPDLVAHPHTIERLQLFGPSPAGEVRVVARPNGFVPGSQPGNGFVPGSQPGKGFVDPRHPRIHVQALDLSRQTVWLELDLALRLVPKFPVDAAAHDRVRFLRDRRYVPGLGLSVVEGDATVATAAAISAVDWLPGTVASLYRSTGSLVEDVAVGDHVARLAEVHPQTVSHAPSALVAEPFAVSSAQPLTRWPIAITRSDDRVTVTSTAPPTLDLDPVKRSSDRQWWVGPWVVEDLFYALFRRFLRRLHLADPDALAATRGQSALYLGNHQVGIETLLLAILANSSTGMSTVALAKAEHQKSWLGRLIAHFGTYPDVRDPSLMIFIDREDKASFPTVLRELQATMSGARKSVIVHVEGTRSVECRTPVRNVGPALLEIAVQLRVPVIPFRFVGGLPTEPTERLEYPVGMGSQDLWLGAPILPETLRTLSNDDRKALAVDRINALGPPNADEEPFPGDPELQARVDARVARTGVDPTHAVMLEILAEQEAVHEDTARMVAGDRSGELVVNDEPRDRWLGELAGRLYGPSGARVRIR